MPDGAVIWFTGLPASGKSTLADALAARLTLARRPCLVVDGDRLRQGLCTGLGWSDADRSENIRRAAEVARLAAEQGQVALCALVSPAATDRAAAAAIVAPFPFIEVHVATALAVCQARDPKGLYARARAGSARGVTGVDAPYDVPAAPGLRLDTADGDTARHLAALEDCLRRACAPGEPRPCR